MAVTNTPNTADMLRKDLYVIFTRPVAPKERSWSYSQTSGTSGGAGETGYSIRCRPDGAPGRRKALTGMIIVRAASFEEAHEIAMGDPFHAEGLREFDIWNWSMNEGSFTVTINYSDQSAAVV